MRHLLDGLIQRLKCGRPRQKQRRGTSNYHLKTSEEKAHYEDMMHKKVCPDIKEAEAQYQELLLNRKDSCKKASIICPENEIEALGGCNGSTPEQLSAQLNRLNQRIQQESRRFEESIDDLRVLHDKKKRKILRKQQTYLAFREKVNACKRALDLRLSKFERNAVLLKRQLTWQFNGHLRKKGISGHIKISYKEKTLSVEVKMPQDASSNTVRECANLLIHPCILQDAVSRKISLDTLVDWELCSECANLLIHPCIACK